MLHRPATQIARSASSSVHHRRHFPSAVRRPVILVPLLIITLAAWNLLNFHLLSEPIPARQCASPPAVLRNKPEIARGDQAPGTDQTRVTVRVANQCWRIKRNTVPVIQRRRLFRDRDFFW